MLFSAGETTWLLRSLSACDEATAVVIGLQYLELQSGTGGSLETKEFLPMILCLTLVP